jgi:hypothetical protein
VYFFVSQAQRAVNLSIVQLHKTAKTNNQTFMIERAGWERNVVEAWALEGVGFDDAVRVAGNSGWECSIRCFMILMRLR